MSALAGCSTAGLAAERTPVALSANAGGWSSADGTRMPSAPVSVITGSGSDRITARFARKIFNTAPIVIVSVPAGAALQSAAKAARAVHAPLLLTGPGGAPTIAIAVRALQANAVLALGLPQAERSKLAAALPGVKLVSRAGELPANGTPTPLRRVDVLITTGTADLKGQSIPTSAELTAVRATAQAAGATVIGLPGADPRADSAAIKQLAKRRPKAVVAVGDQFGSVSLLASRLAVAETGRQLPGGGQVMFPGHRLIALYGYPGTPALGVLGQQDLAASITRARKVAAMYQPLSSVPVVPTFEIIATVAEGSPGPDGTYSSSTPISQLLPWVDQATADGMYVVLDLQPGSANFLQQAKEYQSLLKRPNVGLALDSEWKLQPGQKPLKQIGHVEISEVNSVIRWLAALTARYQLPQKLLVLHQFELSMLQGETHLDTSHDDLAILIHMDGNGTPGVKQDTWNAVTKAAPPGVFFGWKNFLVKDSPMLTPSETMRETPTPVMISYQ